MCSRVRACAGSLPGRVAGATVTNLNRFNSLTSIRLASASRGTWLPDGVGQGCSKPQVDRISNRDHGWSELPDRGS